jgi:hypothetical protein
MIFATNEVFTMSSPNYPIPVDPDIANWVATLNDDARELFEERAAIREYDGGLSRQDAEAKARADVLRWLSNQS